MSNKSTKQIDIALEYLKTISHYLEDKYFRIMAGLPVDEPNHIVEVVKSRVDNFIKIIDKLDPDKENKMDKEYKTKFDTVLDEFKSRVEQSGYDKDSDELIKPSQLFANSSYGKMLLSVTEEREVAEPPLLKKSAIAGSISKVLEDVRAKMSDEVAKRIEFIFQLLGTTVEQQEENFKKLPMHQRWLFKAWIYASASLEYIAFGASKMYKKVVAWIKSINGSIGMDVFHIPEELPSLDDAYNYLKDKVDIEKQLGPLFNPK